MSTQKPQTNPQAAPPISPGRRHQLKEKICEHINVASALLLEMEVGTPDTDSKGYQDLLEIQQHLQCLAEQATLSIKYIQTKAMEAAEAQADNTEQLDISIIQRIAKDSSKLAARSSQPKKPGLLNRVRSKKQQPFPPRLLQDLQERGPVLRLTPALARKFEKHLQTDRDITSHINAGAFNGTPVQKDDYLYVHNPVTGEKRYFYTNDFILHAVDPKTPTNSYNIFIKVYFDQDGQVVAHDAFTHNSDGAYSTINTSPSKEDSEAIGARNNEVRKTIENLINT